MGKGRQLLQGMNVPKVSINWRGNINQGLHRSDWREAAAAGSPPAQVPILQP